MAPDSRKPRADPILVTYNVLGLLVSKEVFATAVAWVLFRGGKSER